jgi:hypothetical protein
VEFPTLVCRDKPREVRVRLAAMPDGHSRRAIAPCALAMALLVPNAASALDEEGWQLALTGDFAYLHAAGRTGGGLGGRLEARYGVTDAWSVWGALASSFHPIDDGTMRASTGSLGATFALDVLRVVPFAELGLSFADVDLGGAGTGAQRGLGGELALGAEYLLDPRWSLAAVARYQYFPVQLAGTARPGLFTVGLRLGRAF